MTSRFADTFFFVALLDRTDARHTDVAAMLESSNDFLVTTRWVLTEVANTFCDTHLRTPVAAWLRHIEKDPDMVIVRANDELYEQGLQLYAARPDKGWSLTDCISFVVMKEREITEALTADHHFEQAGFRRVFV
jgi:predicted nucleic acid-binding protein